MSREEIVKRLKELNNIDKEIKGKIKGTDEKEVKGIIKDEISHIVSDNKYVIQRIEIKNNDIGYRFGYYTFDANYKRLYYGESSPIMKDTDFSILLNKAIEKGWINIS